MDLRGAFSSLSDERLAQEIVATKEDIAGAKRDGVFTEGDNTSKYLAELEREQASRPPQQ